MIWFKIYCGGVERHNLFLCHCPKTFGSNSIGLGWDSVSGWKCSFCSWFKWKLHHIFLVILWMYFRSSLLDKTRLWLFEQAPTDLMFYWTVSQSGKNTFCILDEEIHLNFLVTVIWFEHLQKQKLLLLESAHRFHICAWFSVPVCSYSTSTEPVCSSDLEVWKKGACGAWTEALAAQRRGGLEGFVLEGSAL